MSNIVPINLEKIMRQRDLSMYQYMCERNAMRILLMGYNIEEPLLWMRCGLYLCDEGFSETGRFSTFFSRPMLDTQTLPILGETKEALAWDEIDMHLKQEFPVFISVDVFDMPYKKGTYYHDSHGAHVVLLMGKNVDGYYVLDWYHPDYFYGEVSKEVLTIARTSKNEENKISVFSGFPINSCFKLLHMDKLPVHFNVEQCISNNLFLSVNYLTKATGALYFFEKARKSIPHWVSIPGNIAYQNAIESFFFFDLEIKLLILYWGKLIDSNLFSKLHPERICDIILQMHHSEELLKNKLLFALRRNKSLDSNTWELLLGDLISKITLYCETILNFLKELKG